MLREVCDQGDQLGGDTPDLVGHTICVYWGGSGEWFFGRVLAVAEGLEAGGEARLEVHYEDGATLHSPSALHCPDTAFAVCFQCFRG